MPDDIVTFGSPRDGDSGQAAEEIVRSLFLASYADLVRAARRVTGDQVAAERIVLRGYLDLWRDLERRGRPADPAGHLRQAVLRLATAGRAGAAPGGGDAVAGRHERPGEPAAGPADAARPDQPDSRRAWAELSGLRAESVARRRRVRHRAGAVAAGIVLAAVAVVSVVRLDSSPATPPDASRGPAVTVSLPPLYPAAVAARIPVSGVIDLAGDRGTVWVIRARPPGAGPTSYQLVRIDVGTGRIGWRRSLGRYPPDSMAASAAGIWLTTGRAEAGGQVERLDPVTGKPVGTLHLPAGPCSSVSLVAGRLLAQCATRRADRTVFLMADPATGRVYWRAGPVTSRIFAVAVGPRSVWYDADFSGTYGLIRTARGGTRAVTVYANSSPVNFAYASSLVYSGGFVWALNSDENVAKIDPANGRVVRSYSNRSYDPAHLGGLDFFTVSGGSLWFLDDGYPFSGVLRVSAVTGHQIGGVAGVPAGSCVTVCSQIYATPGSIWVPTRTRLLRIDPARVGG